MSQLYFKMNLAWYSPRYTNFARYPRIEPKDKQPQTLAAAVAKGLADHGTPKILFHNQCKEFEGDVNTHYEDLESTAPRAPHK